MAKTATTAKSAKAARTSRSAKKRQPAKRRSTKSQTKKSAARKGPKPRHTREIGKPATKAAVILDLLKRDNGVILAELMQATGWQAHSVRGYLSGTVRKRLELPLRSESTPKGRRYWIERVDNAQS